MEPTNHELAIARLRMVLTMEQMDELMAQIKAGIATVKLDGLFVTITRIY